MVKKKRRRENKVAVVMTRTQFRALRKAIEDGVPVKFTTRKIFHVALSGWGVVPPTNASRFIPSIRGSVKPLPPAPTCSGH